MKEKSTKQYKEIGLKVAYYRKLAELSQLQFAELIDVSLTHLSNMEAPNVQTSISLELLFKISEVLDAEMKDFLNSTTVNNHMVALSYFSCYNSLTTYIETNYSLQIMYEFLYTNITSSGHIFVPKNLTK